MNTFDYILQFDVALITLFNIINILLLLLVHFKMTISKN